MNVSSKSKWQVRGAVLMIFLIGFVAGALSLNAYHGWALHRQNGEGRRDRFKQTLDRLQLTQDQRNQVEQIFSDTREQLQSLRKESEPRFDEIRKQTDERIQKVLTPEQWQNFQQIRDQKHRQGRRGRSDDR